MGMHTTPAKHRILEYDSHFLNLFNYKIIGSVLGPQATPSMIDVALNWLERKERAEVEAFWAARTLDKKKGRCRRRL